MISKTVSGTVIRYPVGAVRYVEPVAVITRLAFMSMFTDAELEAIYTAAKQSVKVEIYLDKIKAAENVTLTDPRTIAGVEALTAAGLIDAGRVSEILAGA